MGGRCGMAERYLEQIRAIIRVCEDTDGILIVDKNGIIRDHRIAMNYYWKEEETVGHHIRELYPGLDEDSSTILRALRTGQAIYDQRQELVNSRGEQVELDATTIPIVVNGEVEGAVDCARFYVVGQRIVRGGRRGGLSTLGRIVTQSPKMEDLKRRIRSAAQLDSPVLIYGETGTGKELVAEALHSEGPRGGEPFVAQNCAAIPSNLLESLFFGTEKGSYTGALTRKGLLEEADGGTLFLDEIGDLSLQMQVKLLRFLQEKTFSRVGSNRELHADVRFIAATSRNLEELMAANKFREDLYYRLNIFPIVMPDLSKRKGDVMLLAEHFLSKFNLKYGKDIKRLSTPAINMLMAYHWPGNVRELENCMERAVITAQDDCIYGYNLPASLQMPSHDVPYSRDGEAPADLPTMVDSFERELIVAALKRSPGNMSAAARELGISPRVLHYKMHRLGLQKS